MTRDRIRLNNRGSFGVNRWFVEYAPFNGRVKTLTLFGQKEFDTKADAQKAVKRSGGANKLKQKYRRR